MARRAAKAGTAAVAAAAGPGLIGGVIVGLGGAAGHALKRLTREQPGPAQRLGIQALGGHEQDGEVGGVRRLQVLLGEPVEDGRDVRVVVEEAGAADPPGAQGAAALAEAKAEVDRKVDLRTAQDLSPYFRDEVLRTALARKGVGPALMQACMDIAKELKKSVIWLGVWEKNSRAIAFYQKWGFEKFGEHIFPIGDDPQTDWLMKKAMT